MLLLCATDGSIAGRAALRIGAELAERLSAELAALDADTRDPTPMLRDAARTTGCELLVVGYASRTRVDGASLPGWQRRVVRDAPCPVMLVPVDSALPQDGGMLLAYDVPELPYQAARVAGRLAGRLRAPLVITHVMTSGERPSRRPTGWQLYHSTRVLSREAESPAGGSLRVRHLEREGRSLEQLARAAATHEAALVVIGGRRPERGLLPRRSIAPRIPAGVRLPIVVAS
jgi:nucleotide-binding universal stress UspA family protein